MRLSFYNGRHLRVGTRLALGFTLTLLLTLWVALNALSSQDETRESIELMMLEQELGRQAVRLSVLQKRFAISRDVKDAEKVRLSIQNMQDRLHSLSESWPKSEIKLIKEALTKFAASFEDLTVQLELSTSSQLEMLEHAQEMSSRFYGAFLDKLDALGYASDQGGDIDRHSLFELEEVVGLNEKLQKIRDSELRWVLNQEEQHISDWELTTTDASSSIKNLAARVDQEQSQKLSDASEALRNYQAAFKRYHDSIQRSQLEATKADEAAENVGAVLRELNEKHLNKLRVQGKTDRSSLLFVLGLALTAGSLAAWLIRKSIVGPLSHCVEMVGRITDGDLSIVNFKDSRSTNDEVGQLQTAVQRMAERLNHMVMDIHSDVQNLDAAAKTLLSVTSRTKKGLEVQNAATDQAASAVHEMSVAAQDVAKNALETSQAADEANQLQYEGEQILEETRQTAKSLVSEISQGNKAILILDQESQQISKILDVIRSVSDQTNLLALNAAIEAARAGRGGRGFSVVADEIRNLALRTGDSISEIESLITQLHSASKDAIERMQSCEDLSGDVYSLSEKSSDALGRIANSVLLMDKMSHQIADAAKQQSIVSSEISESVDQVKMIANDELQASSELDVSVDGVREVSHRLKSAVNQFSI